MADDTRDDEAEEEATETPPPFPPRGREGREEREEREEPPPRAEEADDLPSRVDRGMVVLRSLACLISPGHRDADAVFSGATVWIEPLSEHSA